MVKQERTLDIIGENFNSSRRLRTSSPRIVREEGNVGVSYPGPDGAVRVIDVTEIWPSDPAELRRFLVPYVGQAVKAKNIDFMRYVIQSQIDAGANIIDLCIDDIYLDPDERRDCMRWLVPVAQGIADVTFAIDSSDPETILAGLEKYDTSKSRPAINSVNLEDGRQVLIEVAGKYKALVFANASGREDMPQNTEGRVENLTQIMALMDKFSVPMADRYLDPLAFPVGAGADFSIHYLDAVKEIRHRYPEVHIFGGHSNTSFGLPQRKVMNNAFIVLSIQAGCDTLMIDPIMNPPDAYFEFKLACDVLMNKDDFAMRYISHFRP
jgi:cobalamin-dependent methionine synthase I